MSHAQDTRQQVGVLLQPVSSLFTNKTHQHKKYLDPEIKKICKDQNTATIKARLDKKIIEKEKMIFEDLSFLLNLTRHRTMSELDLIDRVLSIVAMYFIPAVYKFLFSEFLPSLMKDSSSFDYDSMLIKIQKVVVKLLSNFDGSASNYDNLHPSSIDDTVMKLKSNLLLSVYRDRQYYVGDGHMLKTLIENSYRTGRTLCVTSPSLHYAGLHAINLEKDCIKCVNHVARFLQKFMPVFFIKVKRIENIMMFFESIFRLEQSSVRKISLSSFCEINLSFLQFWSIWQFSAISQFEDMNFAMLNKSLKQKYLIFNINYFSWNIYTSDCYKEYNHTESLEKIIRNLNELYYIHAKIVQLVDESIEKISNDDGSLVYDRPFEYQSSLGNICQVVISRTISPFTIKRQRHMLAHNCGTANSCIAYLNVEMINLDSSDPDARTRKQF